VKILISDADREAVLSAMYRECLRLGINKDYRHRLADAALDALTHSPDVERIYAVEGQWFRPQRITGEAKVFTGGQE
jgi:hypothetical protein